MAQVQRIVDLPIVELGAMLTESRTAGLRAIDRLINDWVTKTNRFDRPGEALFIARQHDQIIGVCGLNRDPYVNSGKVGRVRRLYVMLGDRRQGIGRMLLNRVIMEAQQSFDRLHVRTADPNAAQFYQSVGFTACSNQFVTHQLNLASTHVTD